MTAITKSIQMVDLKTQYLRLKKEIDFAIQEVLDSSRFIKGPVVSEFEDHLAAYLDVKHVISCGNGTDALQIAMMALDLKPGDEVIVPAFTYVATAEVIALLGLTPVMVDVNPETFNVTADLVKAAITERTKAIVPVHLFGQSCEMEALSQLAKSLKLSIIEDNAQAIGGDYFQSDGISKKTGTIGDIGSTSFFPSKNLGCYGDGGALYTDNDDLGSKMRMIANHGQNKKYFHSVIGCNSRLDAIQAAILDVKLKYLDQFCSRRQDVAHYYDQRFAEISDLIKIPTRSSSSSHVFHQYTIQVQHGKRDALKAMLAERGIPSMIYYPLPLYRQEAFARYVKPGFELAVTEQLCQTVLSLPIHTEMDEETMEYIADSVVEFSVG